MSIFEQVIAQNFFVMGESAVYTPADTGAPVTIKVMASRPDEVFTFQSTLFYPKPAFLKFRFPIFQTRRKTTA